MESILKAVKISESVYWVGAIDWKLRNFHGYDTGSGSTYNAYLILGKEPILIDTVKSAFFEEMVARISSVIDPEKIEYIISNHAELDHSGSLIKAQQRFKPKKILASAMGKKALEKQLGNILHLEAVKNGEQLTLGDKTLKFIETRMLHWPDSMFTYYEADKILFSQDGFGMHLASLERFSDQLEKDILLAEASKYYANIILPYSKVVINLLAALPKMNLSIELIAPDHGPIWRGEKDIKWILQHYESWANHKKNRKAVILYDTMWGSTEKMALSMAEGLFSRGYAISMINASLTSRATVITEIMFSEILIVGSPTINNGIFPSLADILTYVKGLKPQNLRGQAFGSYGWSGEAVTLLKEMMLAMNIKLSGEAISFQYVPDSSELQKAFEFGVMVAEDQNG